ncbi:hypothetical protein HK105_206963 [Polyrhizophydium stewartii]|uniref:Cytochrome b561 domain-containing protein n=1 Tax=Polyrhizophydium stewartii TaxID=2732419 RepID=A0ABR4N1Z7_9FUNG|nr:hypothetical protein HK105_003851 [Polyrhizophydium stewartii]
MVIGWPNSSGNITISSRTSSARVQPVVAAKPFATLIDLQIPKPDWATISFSFKWTAVADGSALVAPGNFIYASSPTKVTNGAIQQHGATRGSIAGFNFNSAPPGGNITDSGSASSGKPFLTFSDPASYQLLIKLHGIAMVIAWAVAPFVGIFIARFLKDVLGVWWYRLHLGIMFVFCFLVTIASSLLVFLYKPPPHLSSIHHILGTLVCVLVLIQVVLGFVANALFSPMRDSVPWWDQAHWWLGRTVSIAGIVNLFLGLQLFQDQGYALASWIPLALGAYLFIAFVVLALGERFFGQVTHARGKGTDIELTRKSSARTDNVFKSDRSANGNSGPRRQNTIDTQGSSRRGSFGSATPLKRSVDYPQTSPKPPMPPVPPVPAMPSDFTTELQSPRDRDRYTAYSYAEPPPPPRAAAATAVLPPPQPEQFFEVSSPSPRGGGGGSPRGYGGGQDRYADARQPDRYADPRYTVIDASYGGVARPETRMYESQYGRPNGGGDRGGGGGRRY